MPAFFIRSVRRQAKVETIRAESEYDAIAKFIARRGTLPGGVVAVPILSPPQIDMLRRFRPAEWSYCGSMVHTARALERRGYLRSRPCGDITEYALTQHGEVVSQSFGGAVVWT